MVVAPINHVSLDERGIAFVSGTSIRVSDIVIDAYTWNQSPAQIQDNYPRLSLGQIHSALAYYHDHKTEMDRQMAEWDREYEQIRANSPNPLTRQQLEERLKRTGSWRK